MGFILFLERKSIKKNLMPLFKSLQFQGFRTVTIPFLVGEWYTLLYGRERPKVKKERLSQLGTGALDL